MVVYSEIKIYVHFISGSNKKVREQSSHIIIMRSAHTVVKPVTDSKSMCSQIRA